MGSFPLILAPMEDVTDSPFRVICKQHGADVLVTEFIAAEGLIRDAVKSNNKMRFEPEERPLGIQIFGENVESMMKNIRTRSRGVGGLVPPQSLDMSPRSPLRSASSACSYSGPIVSLIRFS